MFPALGRRLILKAETRWHNNLQPFNLERRPRPVRLARYGPAGARRRLDQEGYAPNRAQIVERRIANSERTRAILGAPLRLSYGPSEIERLDVFRCAEPNAPVNIFVHGGAWRRNRAADYAVHAELFVRAGAHYHSQILSMSARRVAACSDGRAGRRAIAWVYRNAASFGGDPDRLYLTGHSSGAQLGGCMVTTDWHKQGLPADIIKGALLLSGMYDLKPVRLSKRSLYVKFTDEMEQALSAQRHLDRACYAACTRLWHLRNA